MQESHMRASMYVFLQVVAYSPDMMRSTEALICTCLVLTFPYKLIISSSSSAA